MLFVLIFPRLPLLYALADLTVLKYKIHPCLARICEGVVRAETVRGELFDRGLLEVTLRYSPDNNVIGWIDPGVHSTGKTSTCLVVGIVVVVIEPVQVAWKKTLG